MEENEGLRAHSLIIKGRKIEALKVVAGMTDEELTSALSYVWTLRAMIIEQRRTRFADARMRA